MEFKHTPVLLNSVIDGLNIKKDGIYVDCTMGGGGHSYEIIKRLSNKGRLIGFDKDIDAVKVCKTKFKDFQNVNIIHSDFKEAPNILNELGIDYIDGFLIDLGVSSYQIDNALRGFSINNDGKLDMRMNQEQDLDAYYVVNNYSKESLLKILYTYGEESNAKKIVDNIVEYRKIKPITTTFELKNIIEQSFPKSVIYSKGGVSKKTFQAIRIEVNGELKGLENVIENLIKMLNKNGRGAVISFHSLEDRIVKDVFKKSSMSCICPPKTPVCICKHVKLGNILTKKPIIADEKELKKNPRSSSAKLRIFEKI